jgi:hypothetical protein
VSPKLTIACPKETDAPPCHLVEGTTWNDGSPGTGLYPACL